MKKAIANPAPVPQGSPAQRLAEVGNVLRASAKAGQHPVPQLIAVSKTVSADSLRPFLEAGHRVFGENKVQEAIAKWPLLQADYPDVELHLVGQLQSNKAQEAVTHFSVIHSVDRPSLIEALAKAIATTGRRPKLLVQVNIGAEPQKGGVAISDLEALLANAKAAGLEISGLMAVPPAEKDPAPFFALLAKLQRRHNLAELSMGMSADYDLAAALGATYVRIGSSLFGSRA